eukprot:TRINITY_DN1069_c0_g2_i1.p1 TRINITY_DN1069_c0_g2~~TRINITY_DN1069_c0_g2_i1.p1  ORF type:complete len:134 (-),score=37.99 TRINITY_DN1069_c0_g2_i1:342-743(-)
MSRLPFISTLHTKIPSKPLPRPQGLPSPSSRRKTSSCPDIESLSRVSCFSIKDPVKAKSIILDAASFAEPLRDIQTPPGLEPMFTPLQNYFQPLREDIPGTSSISKGSILKNASRVEEDFFVAPPGNAPKKEH